MAQFKPAHQRHPTSGESLQQRALVDAFYEEVGAGTDALTGVLYRRELAISRALTEAGADPQEARAFVRWHRDHHRGGAPLDGLRTYERERAAFASDRLPQQECICSPRRMDHTGCEAGCATIHLERCPVHRGEAA